MAEFKVNYAQLQTAIEAEEKAMRIVSQCADDLMAGVASVAAVGASIGNLGYGKKVWKAYSSACTHQGNLYTLSQTLRRVHDTYMQCENQVLANADEDISVKNGFSKTAVKKTEKAVQKQQNFSDKNVQNVEKTWKDAIFEGTIGGWIENYKQMGTILDEWKDFRENAGDALSESGYGFLEKAGLPDSIIGGIRYAEEKLTGIYESYESVFDATLHLDDPKAAMKGVVSYISLLDPTGKKLELTKPLKNFGKVWDKGVDVLSENSERMITLLNQLEECVREGDFAGAAVTVGSGVVEVGKMGTEVGARWLESYVDSSVLKEITWASGDILTLEDFNEDFTDQTGFDFLGGIHAIGEGIGDDLGSLMDDFYQFVRNRSAWR